MGNDSTPKKQKYLSNEEINEENNNYIKELFQKYKNYDGVLSKNDFSRIINGLIDNHIINIIFQFCSSKNNILSKRDFKYFYALLKTKSFDAKIHFLLYFIFEENTILQKNMYVYLVQKYYKDCWPLYNIFLDKNIINNEIIEKNKIIEYIKYNYKSHIENYIFNEEISQVQFEDNIPIKENNKENFILYSTKKTCLCLSKKNNIIYASTDFYSTNVSLIEKYDSLKNKFNEYKLNNNGIFPISLLRSMLKEIHIYPSLIDLIINYIEKKTQKGICTFELFKEVLYILTIDLEGEEKQKNKKIFINGLFLLFSYPNNYIDKTNFCSFIQLTKNDFSLISMNDILNKYEIPKKITIEKFEEIIDYLIIELFQALERMKYIHYIYFDYPISDKKNEYDCIQIILNGKNITEYVIHKASFENKFYIINIDFWETWEKNMTTQNYEELKFLKINTEKLCDKNGQMKEGLVYLSDYIILTELIYKLFCKWYGRPCIEIEREKIFIDNGKENELYYKSLDELDKDVTYFFRGEDSKTHKKYEIEISPIFLLILLYQEIQSNSITELKEIIQKKIEAPETKFIKYSRKTKFSKLLLIFQEKLRMELDENNSRFWIYYYDKFEVIKNNNETLENQGIFNKAVIILEINKHGKWPLDELTQKKKEENKEQYIPLMGLMNLGNTCYMNSILQVFLNMEEMEKIFKLILSNGNNFLNFFLNCKSGKVIIVEEFLNLLKKKYIEKKKTLAPKQFKKICGTFNENYQGSIQQDANDFFIFLLQSLHEGANIKTKEIRLENRNQINENENEKDLGNEYWSNTVRNNASYFYGLFTGQLESKLICQKCNKTKIKYEPYSSLDLPIPEDNNIIIFIKLFRLPLSLSSFKNIEKNKLIRKADNSKGQEKNIYLKKQKFDISINEEINLKFQNNQKLDNLHDSVLKDELIQNELNFNIPILLKLEFSRKDRCEMIINTLKSMSELSLDINGKYTQFVILSRNRYINPNLTIDETIENFGRIDIYELINYEGIKYIFNYQDLFDIKALPITDEEKNYTINNMENDIFNENIKEIMIEIKHRVKKNMDGNNYLVDIPLYLDMTTNRDFLILSNYRSIKIFDLYEIIWKKCMYFCDMPAKLENNLWWKNSSKEKENQCSPFLLKIVKKTTRACAFCPWYKFCTGCVLNPEYKEYYSIPKNCYLMVEWCRKVKLKQIKDENILLILNHSSMNMDIEPEINKKMSIYDCFELFTQKEEIENIFCENCQKKETFTKILKIERIPEYLVITLKRFKYTIMYRTKINCPIKFPMNKLDIGPYLTDNTNNEIYDLYAVVNHIGNLSSGHYFSIVKQNNTWIQYNDSVVSEFSRTFDTQEAYILIYKLNRDKNNINLNFKFDFWGLMNTAYKIYNKKYEFSHLFNYHYKNGRITKGNLEDCYFYYGEPIIIDGKRGFIINAKKNGDSTIYLQIKFEDKIREIKCDINNNIKETIKDNNLIKEHKIFNIDYEKTGCTNECCLF